MPIIDLNNPKTEDSSISDLKNELKQQHIELIAKQEAILQQLKILNTYMNLITNTQIKESDVCK